jgi:hypothetical protein
LRHLRTLNLVWGSAALRDSSLADNLKATSSGVRHIGITQALSNVAVTPTEEELRSIAASSSLEKLRALQAQSKHGATGPARLSN